MAIGRLPLPGLVLHLSQEGVRRVGVRSHEEEEGPAVVGVLELPASLCSPTRSRWIASPSGTPNARLRSRGIGWSVRPWGRGLVEGDKEKFAVLSLELRDKSRRYLLFFAGGTGADPGANLAPPIVAMQPPEATRQTGSIRHPPARCCHGSTLASSANSDGTGGRRRRRWSVWEKRSTPAVVQLEVEHRQRVAALPERRAAAACPRYARSRVGSSTCEKQLRCPLRAAVSSSIGQDHPARLRRVVDPPEPRRGDPSD